MKNTSSLLSLSMFYENLVDKEPILSCQSVGIIVTDETVNMWRQAWLRDKKQEEAKRKNCMSTELSHDESQLCPNSQNNCQAIDRISLSLATVNIANYKRAWQNIDRVWTFQLLKSFRDIGVDNIEIRLLCIEQREAKRKYVLSTFSSQTQHNYMLQSNLVSLFSGQFFVVHSTTIKHKEQLLNVWILYVILHESHN